jgi:hypothetical protein
MDSEDRDTPRIRFPAGLVDHGADLGGGMFPDRTVDVACLAKPAALGAATHHLDAGPVVDDLHVGDGEPAVVEPVQRQRGPLPHRLSRSVQGRDVHPVDSLHRPEEILTTAAAPLPLPDRVAQLQGRVLAVADEEGIHEVRQRLRGEGDGTSRHDQRMPLVPAGPAEGDAGKVEHVQDGGEGQLVLEGELQDIKARQGGPTRGCIAG